MLSLFKKTDSCAKKSMCYLVDVISCFYSITNGEVKVVEGELSKSLLENSKCFLLDCGDEIFVWVGRVTQVDERKAASQAAEVVHVFFSVLQIMCRKYIICSF